ncbi:MAG: RplW [Fibrobacteria bacterium]|jgi:large subunit ribosomal protein L23|nr:RplW [Fibrobacteria bacterium]
MKPLKDIIGIPLLSEKSLERRASANQYVFRVSPSANKSEIKKAIETRFEVKVESVNTLNMMGKVKQVRGIPGRRAAWKKAIVKLKQGDTIKELE